jgi:hypothetical protein
MQSPPHRVVAPASVRDRRGVQPSADEGPRTEAPSPTPPRLPGGRDNPRPARPHTSAERTCRFRTRRAAPAPRYAPSAQRPTGRRASRTRFRARPAPDLRAELREVPSHRQHNSGGGTERPLQTDARHGRWHEECWESSKRPAPLPSASRAQSGTPASRAQSGTPNSRARLSAGGRGRPGCSSMVHHDRVEHGPGRHEGAARVRGIRVQRLGLP